MIELYDERVTVGQIVDAVDKAGARKNTLIIFSSDNGGPQPGVVTDNGKYRAGKGTLYEGGVRVARVGYYRLTADGNSYARQDTVLLPFPGDGMRMRAGTLRSRVDAQRLAEAMERY